MLHSHSHSSFTAWRRKNVNPGGKNVPKYLTFLHLAFWELKLPKKSLKISAGMFVQAGLRRIRI